MVTFKSHYSYNNNIMQCTGICFDMKNILVCIITRIKKNPLVKPVYSQWCSFVSCSISSPLHLCCDVHAQLSLRDGLVFPRPRDSRPLKVSLYLLLIMKISVEILPLAIDNCQSPEQRITNTYTITPMCCFKQTCPTEEKSEVKWREWLYHTSLCITKLQSLCLLWSITCKN